MSKNKITLVLSSFKGGGAEKMMINLANGIADKEVNVELIALRPYGPYEELIQNNVKVVKCPVLPSIYMYVPFLIFLFIKNRPGKIISTQTHINIVTMLAALPLFLKKRVIFREANTPSTSYSDLKGFKRVFINKLAFYIYKLPKKIVAISKGVQIDLIKVYDLNPKVIKVIHSPVVTSKINQLSKEVIEKSYFNEGAINVLAVGNVSKQKDYETLIRSIYKVIINRPVHLLILGGYKTNSALFNSLTETIIELNIESNVKFLGFVENPYAYMSKADLFVLSSKWEGFGNVLVEALACGCPVVSTDCPGGPREILDNGKYGKLVPVGDADEMAKAILSSLESPTNKKTLINRGYEFTQEKSVNEYLNYIFSTDKC